MFLLVNEDTVRRYKSGLADEIEPAIVQLIELAEQGLNALEKQEQALQTKVILDGFGSGLSDRLSADRKREIKKTKCIHWY